jgi:hypothetical protein
MLERAAGWLHVDFAPGHGQPRTTLVLLAAVGSIVGSLAADAILVLIGEAIFPSTKGYGHFRFSDYGKLTVIGVVIAAAAWPIVTRVTSMPRWLFFRLAIVVTLVLWLPDLYILHQGQPGRAVGVLMVMHLAIALVTYNVLIHVAPVRGGPPPRSGHAAPSEATDPRD